jgi:hypothetical protein
MQLISKKAVKYDATLFIVEVLTKDMKSYTELTNYCVLNKILYDMERQTLPAGTDLLTYIRSRRNEGNILLTMRISDKQLTEIILHFG